MTQEYQLPVGFVNQPNPGYYLVDKAVLDDVQMKQEYQWSIGFVK